MVHKNLFNCGDVFGRECRILWFWDNLSILKSDTVVGCDKPEVLAITLEVYPQSLPCLVGLDDIRTFGFDTRDQLFNHLFKAWKVQYNHGNNSHTAARDDSEEKCYIWKSIIKSDFIIDDKVIGKKCAIE